MNSDNNKAIYYFNDGIITDFSNFFTEHDDDFF